MKRTIPHYVIMIILIGIIFLQRECHRCPDVQTITTTDTIPGDSVPYAVEVDKPIPYWIDTGSWHYLAQNIDTMAILKDYFSRVYYLDTIMDDSSAFIAILDTISQNRILGRKLYFANRKPTSIINTTTVHPADPDRLKLYAGAMLSFTPEAKSDIGPVIMMMTPKGGGYSYAYGVNEKSHTLTVVWKIKLRRKVPP